MGQLVAFIDCPLTIARGDVSRRLSPAIAFYAGAEEPCSSAGFLVADGFPLICCFKIADGLNRSTRRGEIGTSVPVFGLRPMRSFFLRTMKDPNVESLTVSPFSRASVISLSTNSIISTDVDRDSLPHL